MRQNDYYKKKNFANPNIFQSSSNSSSNERSMPVPTKPAPSRPDPPQTSANNASGSTEGQEVTERSIVEMCKHPLQHCWALWYRENELGKSWEENQHKITTFDTVEDFWSLYNHIKLPSDIKVGTDYSIFKEGIRPMWEDSVNKSGGCWNITNKMNLSKHDMDNMWLDTLLCLIGEAFEHTEEICGAVITNRKFGKITVWTANADNSEAVLAIGRKLKECLRLGNMNLTYTLHKDTMVKTGSSYVRPVHSI